MTRAGLADLYADQDDNRRASLSRRRAVTRRSPGCRWPRAGLIEGVSDHQRDQLGYALSRPLGILAGTPGTGKTYTAARVIHEVGLRHGYSSIAVCAPTGKAAVRIGAALRSYGIDQVRPTTIHSLLEIGRNGHDGEGWGFQRTDKNPLDQWFVFVDEASMLDVDLAASLLRACCDGTHLLLIGDPYQLPPVGHGAPLRDLIGAGVPCGTLTEIRRNAGMIVEACAAIKDGREFRAVLSGDNPDFIGTEEGMNLGHFEEPTPERQLLTLRGWLDMGVTALGLNPVWDCQVFTAVNTSGPLSRREVNRQLQTHLNPEGARAEGNPFRRNDKVICTRNSWHQTQSQGQEVYVANGEMGVVTDLAERVIVVKFEEPHRVIRVPMGKPRKEDEDEDGGDGGSGCDFDLGYAITVHKSQGSEWPCGIILADPSPGARQVCSREWLYTAISRASRLCVTIGRKGVLDMMPRRPALTKRKTFLPDLLGTIL